MLGIIMGPGICANALACDIAEMLVRWRAGPMSMVCSLATVMVGWAMVVFGGLAIRHTRHEAAIVDKITCRTLFFNNTLGDIQIHI